MTSAVAPAASRAGHQLRNLHDGTLWRSSLGSGLRASLACAIVGYTLFYSPPAIRRRLVFPAFSYVSAILISGEATLGETVQGVACAFYGSILGVLPATLSMSLVGPAGLSIEIRTLAVALSSLVVALPESIPLLAKRLALGQITLVYAAPLRLAGSDSPIWQPVHVAANTALGMVASLLALLLPYPRLACHEVARDSALFREIALKKMRVLVDALCADSRSSAAALISEAQRLSEFGSKLLHSINMKRPGVKWEKPPPKSRSAPECDRLLQAINSHLKGMELAVRSVPSFPVKSVGLLKSVLSEFENQVRERLEPEKPAAAGTEETSSSPPWITKEAFGISPTPDAEDQLPPLVFLFCMKLLRDEVVASRSRHPHQQLAGKRVAAAAAAAADVSNVDSSIQEQNSSLAVKKTRSILPIRLNSGALRAALKCSFSMGLAVYLGLLFNKDGGYWSGLAVAILMTPWREATFRRANARAHGTALGTVYGVLGAFVSPELAWLRILLLLPWMVLTSFLRRSRMFGHAGGISAALAPIMILGRKYGGTPEAFAITRLTETYIGICCSVLADLLLQPSRASSLVRTRLSQTTRSLRGCIRSVDAPELKEKVRSTRKHVDRLRKLIEEADGEPNFCFAPFPAPAYEKLQNSLGRMVDLLPLMGHSLESLKAELCARGAPPIEFQELLGDGDVVIVSFKKVVGSLLTRFEHIAGILIAQEGIAVNDGETGTCSDDLEMGGLPADDQEAEQAVMNCVSLFLRRAADCLKRTRYVEEGLDEDNQIALCLGTLGFSMCRLVKEAEEIQKVAFDLAL